MVDFSEFWDGLGCNRYVLVLVAGLFCYHLICIIYKSVIVMSKSSFLTDKRTQGVSVIITSDNKAEYLQKNLEGFLNQDYPNYEVIVVDECSEDETQEVLAELQQKYSHLRTTRIFPDTKFRSTKKIAINIGVLAAKHDILLFSEINCVPETSHWVEAIQSCFDSNTSVVLAFANYEPGKGNISIRRYFRFLRFVKMLLLVKGGMNVMGEGCNMAYRKSYYIEKRGFSKNSQIYMGYDNEMVGQLAQKGCVKVVKDADARILIKDERRKTWIEDYSYYYAIKKTWPFVVQLKANFGFILEFLLYGFSFYLIFAGVLYKYVALLVLLTFVIDFIVTNLYLRHLTQKKLFLTSFIVNSLGLFYKCYFSIYSMFTSKKWR